jgi:hypothetical protein
VEQSIADDFDAALKEIDLAGEFGKAVAE